MVSEKSKDVEVKDLKAEDQYLLAQIEKMVFKIQEIQSMMKNGEFIVAYEKQGGVLKNMLATGGVLQRRIATYDYGVKK
jgi:hypothetical protein